jgi:hypothetical protein
MANSSKPPKTPKNAKGGTSSNDRLETSYGSFNIKSDYVYSQDSQIFKLATSSLSKDQLDKITGFSFEYELSPSKIVYTEKITVSQPFITANGSLWISRTRRSVQSGTFPITRSKKGASLTTNIPITRNTEGAVSPLYQGYDPYGGYSTEQYIDTEYQSGSNQSEVPASAHYYEVRHTGEIFGNTDDLGWFRSYEGGRFFGKGWYLNPFGENLL